MSDDVVFECAKCEFVLRQGAEVVSESLEHFRTVHDFPD